MLSVRCGIFLIALAILSPVQGLQGNKEAKSRVKRGGMHYCQTNGIDPCQHGKCRTTDGGHATYYCDCDSCWKGLNCELVDCSCPQYCQNGGTCSTTSGGTVYTCKCRDGWMGGDCELIDCSYSQYCQNGGTCSTTRGGTAYTCKCRDGWMGGDCELIDCSYSQYCQNGGTCSTTRGGTAYNCKCRDGWMGGDCELIDCSYSQYCQNGGTCSTTRGGTAYTCKCRDGWMGGDCELIDCSYSQYCQNGGTCSTTRGGTAYNCKCRDGWMGGDCELIDCSYSQYCQNGGTCSTTSGGTAYNCKCRDGWMGGDCELIDCSYSQYCQNGGTCSTTKGGTAYTCHCVDGWMGNNCELINCSSKVHCVNSGTCTPINGGHDKLCTCYYGWTGPNCAQTDVCTPYKQADIVFVIDGSLSRGNTTFSEQKEYVKNFMSKYRVGPPNNRYQFSLLTYSLDPKVEFYLNTYDNDADLQDAVDLVTYNGGPSFTGKALRKVHQDVFISRNGARNFNTVERYVVLLTDGLSSDPADTVKEADILKANGVKIYTVGGGNSVRHEELLKISSFKGYVFPMATNDSLQNLLKYTMFGCKNCTTNVSDVAIVMDVSANIGIREFDTQIKAVIHLLRISAVGPIATQFSYSTFANTMNNVFSFDKFSITHDLISEVNLKTKTSDSRNANVSNVLNALYQNGFSSSEGSRLQARQVVVLVTAGVGIDIQQAKAAAKRLKDSGRIVVTIGVGLSANMSNLLEISSDPAFTYIIGDDVYIDVNVLDSLWTTLVYDYCSGVR